MAALYLKLVSNQASIFYVEPKLREMSGVVCLLLDLADCIKVPNDTEICSVKSYLSIAPLVGYLKFKSFVCFS